MTESLNPELAAQHHRGVEPAPGTTALPDLLLVERARGKEIRAFETLMRRYNQRLFRIARSIVPDRDIAETVVQEAYLLAFSDIERYEPTGKFGAWLARLAFNQALALRRTVRPGATATESSSSELDRVALDSSGSSPAVGPSDTQASRQLLEQAIDALPEVFRTVFVLRAIEGISGIETAACLGINETTVRTRLYRAQRRLRIDWTQHAPSERSELFELTSTRGDHIVNRVLGRLNGASRSQEVSERSAPRARGLPKAHSRGEFPQSVGSSLIDSARAGGRWQATPAEPGIAPSFRAIQRHVGTGAVPLPTVLE